MVTYQTYFVPLFTHTIQVRPPIARSRRPWRSQGSAQLVRRTTAQIIVRRIDGQPHLSSTADTGFVTTCVVDQNSAGSSASKVAAAPDWEVAQGGLSSVWRNDEVVKVCANVRMVESSGRAAILQWTIWLHIRPDNLCKTNKSNIACQKFYRDGSAVLQFWPGSAGPRTPTYDDRKHWALSCRPEGTRVFVVTEGHWR